MNTIKRLFGICLLAFPFGAFADVQKLVDEIIEAYGGANAWSKVTAFHQQGRTYSERLGRFGKTERSYQHPNRMRVDIDYGGDETELRQLDGEEAWSHGKKTLPAYADAVRMQAYRISLPLLLIDQKDKAQELGSRQDGPVTLRGLMFDFGNGRQLILDVNDKTKRVAGSWAFIEIEGNRSEFATLYDDYRMVDGKLVAFKETHYAMGGPIGYTELKEINFAPEFPANTFKPAN